MSAGFYHLPFSLASGVCLGWGNYAAATVLAILALCYAVVGVIERLEK